jgi:hypothetical protein
VFVVDADGSNVKQVDSYTALCGCDSIVAISADGNTIASSDHVQTRIVDLNGTLKHSIVFDSNETSAIALDATGSTVFMQQARNAATSPGGVAIERGIWKMSTAGGAPTQVLGPAAVSALIGGSTPDQIFPFRGCVGGFAVSSDGATVASATYVNGANAIVTSGAGGAKLVIPPLTDRAKLVITLGLSDDGAMVAYYVNSSAAAGAEVGVIGADGTGRKKLFEGTDSDSCESPLVLSADKKTLMIGHYAMVHPTDGVGEPWLVLAATGAVSPGGYFLGEPAVSNSRTMTMSADGKRFVWPSHATGNPRFVSIAELDATALGSVPEVSAPKVSRPSITRDGPKASLSANAPVGAAVGSQMFLPDGTVENTGISNGQLPLSDAAGNGTFTSAEAVTASQMAKVGKRTLRIKAETKDAGGKRSAHFVDFGPFAVE